MLALLLSPHQFLLPHLQILFPASQTHPAAIVNPTDDQLMSNDPTIQKEVDVGFWLQQTTSGIFVGTGPDESKGPAISGQCAVTPPASFSNPHPIRGILDVSGLALQFPDGTPLWMKYAYPGESFGTPNITFSIDKFANGVYQHITDFSVPVTPSTNIVRLAIPAFSIGPGEYMITHVVPAGQAHGGTYIMYLAPGQKTDPNYGGSTWW